MKQSELKAKIDNQIGEIKNSLKQYEETGIKSSCYDVEKDNLPKLERLSEALEIELPQSFVDCYEIGWNQINNHIS
ncbi:hypothetical protein SAMN04487977_101475 [Treponema bryantii]|uniref:Uncharacterized protein n=1 Tax=Treponema bryantii TaxID=163 RepID=A0A1H9AUJ2_9SPIR|nr:hypothetical protein [Treponema bryantii]SEP80410.1 hypothetical protein SAMN04487977_101475 [Treponema bryantii]